MLASSRLIYEVSNRCLVGELKSAGLCFACEPRKARVSEAGFDAATNVSMHT
jgi:hypothetical protein